MIFSKINRKPKKKPRHKNDIETFYSNFGVNNTRKKIKSPNSVLLYSNKDETFLNLVHLTTPKPWIQKFVYFTSIIHIIGTCIYTTE